MGQWNFINISYMKPIDVVRQIVSGPKIRYKKDGYNLDLSYITPRIIAMAYPAEGIQKLYRNSIDAVAEFLNEKHQKNYQIINVSGRTINNAILSNIRSFYWEDHKTPQFHVLFSICEIMLEHLLTSVRKVCVVHCNHGKGRTGTLICCFLMYTGYFDTPDQAIRFYAKRRFQTEGYGVTQPCQIQYIHYFNELLKKPKMYPSVISIYKIELKGDHNLTNPYFKLRHVRDGSYLFNTKDEQLHTLQVDNDRQIGFRLRESPNFYGDVVLEIKHCPMFGKHSATNYAFNTTFFDSKLKMIEVRIKQFSPLSSIKSGLFGQNFRLRIYYKNVCGCPQEAPLQNRCQKCLQYLKGERIQNWEQIYKILKNKPKINGKEVLFGNQQEAETEKERNKTY